VRTASYDEPSRGPSAPEPPTALLRDAATTWGDAVGGAVGRPQTAAEQAFVDIVASLHHELEGMRASARLRAVIEQAKGILVAQHGISLSEAFERLREMSQEHNVRLVEVAATLVGANLPPGESLDLDLDAELHRADAAPVSDAWRAFREEPDVQAGTARAVVHAISGSAASAREAGELLGALAAPFGVAAVAMYRLASDGALRMVASWGLSGATVTGWETIPPGVDVPVMRAALRRETIALPSLAARARQFPMLLSRPIRNEATVNVPIIDGDAVTGSVMYGWPDVRDLDPATIERIEQITRIAGPILVRRDLAVDPEALWLPPVLDILFDPWLLLEPVPDDDGRTVGFRVVGACHDIPHAAGLMGRRFIELWPAAGPAGVFEHLLAVEAHGWPWVAVLGPEATAGLPLTSGATEVRVIRVGTRVLLHWRAVAGDDARHRGRATATP
jgi:hypothetical protein